MRLARLSPEPTEPTRLGFDMLISDFGPIKKAAISLRPLTIFIGGNDLGKSYAAMLAHSVISTGRGLGQDAYSLAPSIPGIKTPEGLLGGFKKVIDTLKPGGEAAFPPRLVTQLTRMCVDEYQVRLQREIMRNFGSPLSELTRSGTGHFSMTLKVGKRSIMSYKKDNLTLNSMPKFGIVLEMPKATSVSGRLHFEWRGDTVHYTIEDDIARMINTDHLFAYIYGDLRFTILQRAIGTLPTHSHYFPAARSGILQAHRVITSNIVRNAPYAGIEDIHVPRLSGVVSDFVSSIIDMHPIHGAHHDTGLEIENDIFGGQTELKYADPGTIPEIVYKRSEIDVPIHRTSSTVSELAPFTLHLKHRRENHGVLIIEEPEAHLHPRNQSLLARHIVKLVRDGANIIITTHSSALFESVSQYLQASRLGPKERENAFGRKDLYLHEDEIAPHLFKMDGGGGSVVERIDMSAEDGIVQEEFVKEDRMLNETNLRIEEHSS